MAKGFAKRWCLEMPMNSGCGVIADESRMAKGFADNAICKWLILLNKKTLTP